MEFTDFLQRDVDKARISELEADLREKKHELAVAHQKIKYLSGKSNNLRKVGVLEKYSALGMFIL